MSEIKYYPLTHPQKGIWNIEKVYQNTSIGIVAGTLRLKGNVDYDILEKAVNLFIINNDGFRLRVIEQDGDPKQYISEYKSSKIDLIDFSKYSDPVQELFKWEEEQSKTPFKLIGSDLFRFTMVKVNDEDGGFYLKTHHLISDAWNMSIVGNHIIEYYSSLKNGTPVFDKKSSYLDFLESEQEYKNSERFIKDKEYWNGKFEEGFEITTLKTRKTNEINTETIRRTFTTPLKFTNKLREYCSQNKTSPYTLFLCALSMYINRVLSKENIILGTTLLNRSNSKEKNTVGMFINTVPVCIKYNETLDFKTFSEYMSKETTSILRHQKYPYDLLLKEIRKRHHIYDNLYDIVLSYQNTKFNKAEHSEEYKTRWHFCGHQTNSLSIHINDREDDGHLIIDYDFHKDLFYIKEIEFIHSHIISLLWHALDNPTRPLCKVEMLTESEKHKILYEFNNTQADYPKDKTIHQLFEEQAERTPDNTALVFEDKSMTYRELNEKSNQLARVLREKGVKPDSIVGLMVYRSFEMIIGIFGVLKAGGAYLPIDPEYPDERIKYMLEDSGSRILLTEQKLSGNIPFSGETLYLDSNRLYSGRTSNLKRINKPKDLAYVIYTSGSTGRPKGVMIEHSPVINRINWMQKKYPLYENSVIIQKTPYTFDVSVWELFWWFFVGAKLAILVPEGEKSPEHIIKCIDKNKVTTIHFVPSMLNVFLEYIETKKSLEELKSITQVFASGEALTIQHVHKFNKLLGCKYNTKLHNLYGPTEATVDVSYFDCEELGRLHSVPIGKPIDNIKLLVLNNWGQLQPIGIAGELYITGIGLARGYLNKPELTSEKFVPNPYSEGELMYKTGDLARWYPNGDIEYLGRIDFQIKIRGFRVELGEIERQILDFDNFKAVAVIDRQDKNGNKYLCAYIASEKKIDILEIKSYLKEKLPDYMIPSYFSQIEDLPLSANGKLDRKKLPEPERYEMTSEFVEPTNDIEKKLSDIWRQVLKTSKVGINDDFFELSGDSLTVIEAMTAALKYNWNLSTQDFYKYSTIKKLAEKINSQLEDDNELLIKLSHNDSELSASIICFPYGGGSFGVYKELADSLSKISNGYSLYAVNLPGHSISNMKSEFLSIEEAGIALIDEIKKKIKGNIILYGHCVGCALTIETARLLEKEKISVIGTYVGGIFPPKFVKYYGSFFDPWKLHSDKGIINFLNKIGLPGFDFSDEETKYMMNAFRYDVKAYYKYCYKYLKYSYNKLSTPIISIVGENDPLTRNHNKGFMGWYDFSNTVKKHIIKDAGHYLIKSHSDELAKIITNIK